MVGVLRLVIGGEAADRLAAEEDQEEGEQGDGEAVVGEEASFVESGGNRLVWHSVTERCDEVGRPRV